MGGRITGCHPITATARAWYSPNSPEGLLDNRLSPLPWQRSLESCWASVSLSLFQTLHLSIPAHPDILWPACSPATARVSDDYSPHGSGVEPDQNWHETSLAKLKRIKKQRQDRLLFRCSAMAGFRRCLGAHSHHSRATTRVGHAQLRNPPSSTHTSQVTAPSFDFGSPLRAYEPQCHRSISISTLPFWRGCLMVIIPAVAVKGMPGSPLR